MSTKLKIVSVVGARPQFVKLAPVARAFEEIDTVSHHVVHTGQHYDDKMSSVFFDELELPRPDLDLKVGSGSHAVQTGAMLTALESAFESLRPDVVLAYGDTNSTLAATIAASKMHLPVAHIEAGLRSFNRAMPEEINRLVADHCSDRLYAPTPTAMSNLCDENLAERAIQSGDVMRDAVLHNTELAMEKSRILESLKIEPGQYSVLTIHRPVNTTPTALRCVLSSLEEHACSHAPLIFPVHPRALSLVLGLGYKRSGIIRITDPVSFLDMLRLLDSASVVFTDSGGVQKEAAFVGTPCITLREETEWTETVDLGLNRLVGQDPTKIRSAIDDLSKSGNPFNSLIATELDSCFGTGNAATNISSDLVNWCRAL